MSSTNLSELAPTSKKPKTKLTLAGQSIEADSQRPNAVRKSQALIDPFYHVDCFSDPGLEKAVPPVQALFTKSEILRLFGLFVESKQQGDEPVEFIAIPAGACSNGISQIAREATANRPEDGCQGYKRIRILVKCIQ